MNHVIEVYEYEKMPYPSKSGGRKKKEESDGITSYDNRKISTKKARDTIRRICTSNFTSKSKFITLTFRDGSVNDVKSVDECNREFKKFIQRLRRRYGGFKYIAVIEFQDTYGRGAVHYHMMSDLPYIDNEELNKIWRNGFVKINDISECDNTGAYLVKYICKDLQDERLMGRKAYLVSKGLERPSVVRGDTADAIYEDLDLNIKKEVFANSYTSEHHGIINYKQYNMRRG